MKLNNNNNIYTNIVYNIIFELLPNIGNKKIYNYIVNENDKN